LLSVLGSSEEEAEFSPFIRLLYRLYNRGYVATRYSEDSDRPLLVEKCSVPEGGFEGAYTAWAVADRAGFCPSLDPSYTLFDHLLNIIAGLPVAVAFL
jgi:hypothetical protein